jgi:DNA polymerase-1
MSQKQLYIIDGHALIYRAYFALIKTPMSTAAGQPTGAIFGFANYLLRLLEFHDCTHWIVALDSPVPTFRHEMYEQYKANREAMPDDLRSQMPLIDRLIEAFNISTMRQPGFEADDLIAGLARRAESQGFEVFIVSKDKDLMQLVGERVKLLAPENGSEFTVMGPQEVKKKMGVPPELIPDYLALSGDSSDNIPGVEGVGPKTAIKILEEVGSVKRLLEHPELVTNSRLREKIVKNRENLVLSRKLVTLNHEAGIELPIESLQRAPMHRAECRELFRELEMHSFLRNPLFAEESAKLEFSAVIVKSLDELEAIIANVKQHGRVSIDTETTSTAPRGAEIVGVSLAVEETEAFYVPLGHVAGDNLPLEKALNLLKPMLESAAVKKIGQNLKYDCQIFKNYNVILAGIEFDCMIAAYLIDPGKRQYNLDRLAEKYLACATTPIEKLIGKGWEQKSFAATDIGEAASYSGEDVVLPLRLQKLLEPQLTDRSLEELFRTIEIPLVSVLAELEWQGVLIDTTLLKKLSIIYKTRMEAITAEVWKLAGKEFNLNSPKQVSDVLFHDLKLPRSKKTKVGSFETNFDVLEKLADDFPIARKILDHREVAKLLSTYIDALPLAVNPASGRLHTSFNQTVTATGRLSSTGPNLQNIPVRTEDGRRIREAFIASPGCTLVSADYSQIELRILAHLSKDPQLTGAFLEDKDIHVQTAAAIYLSAPELVTDEMRRAAKTINFGLMYGMGPVNLARQLGISFSNAQKFIEVYFSQFPNVKQYLDSTVESARERGYTETMFGRRRYLPELNSDNHNIRTGAERIAINTPIQGSAADIIKIAMIDIAVSIPKVNKQAKMLLQVHDELVFEVPIADAKAFAKWVANKMSSVTKLSVPLKVDTGIGENWSNAH